MCGLSSSHAITNNKSKGELSFPKSLKVISTERVPKQSEAFNCKSLNS